MNELPDMLLNITRILKFYDAMRSEVCEKHSLTRLEVDIIAFLKNNPGLDTASDIVEHRMLPKANVSQAVELLIRKKLLVRIRDKSDRRKIHLHLSSGASGIIDDIASMQARFLSSVFSDFSDDEKRQYLTLNTRIGGNALDELGSGGKRV